MGRIFREFFMTFVDINKIIYFVIFAVNHTSSSLDSINSQSDQKPITLISLANALENYTSAPLTKRGTETVVKNEHPKDYNLPRDLGLLSSPSSDLSDRPTTTMSIGCSQGECSKGGSNDSLLGKRVRVYPRKPNLVLPQGATLLPFSDDMWVAVSLDLCEGKICACNP